MSKSTPHITETEEFSKAIQPVLDEYNANKATREDPLTHEKMVRLDYLEGWLNAAGFDLYLRGGGPCTLTVCMSAVLSEGTLGVPWYRQTLARKFSPEAEYAIRKWRRWWLAGLIGGYHLDGEPIGFPPVKPPATLKGKCVKCEGTGKGLLDGMNEWSCEPCGGTGIADVPTHKRCPACVGGRGDGARSTSFFNGVLLTVNLGCDSCGGSGRVAL